MSSPVEADGRQWTCTRLEGGLTFYGDRVQACCVRHHENRGHVILVEHFDGKVFPLEEIVRARQQVAARLQEPRGYSRCSGCVLLERRAPTRRKYLVDYLDFAHEIACNLNCTYCNNQLDSLKRVHNPPRLFPLVKGMLRDGLVDLKGQTQWAGGEPTLLHEFEEMSSFLAEIGMRQSVFTNGVMLSTAALKWIPRSLTRMYISVDAGTPETYRRIKGADAFEQVWKNIARYIKAGGGRVVPKMILMKENLGEVRQFVERAEKAGAQRVVVDPNSREAQLPDEIVEAAAVMMEECARRGIRLVAGVATLHSRPELKFHDKVHAAYQARRQSRSLSDQLIQRMGTAMAVRHTLRLARKVTR